jgi:DNA-binding NtrC family response regulator
LIVEDEVAIQELIAVNLESAGHHALRASNAEQALTIIRRPCPIQLASTEFRLDARRVKSAADATPAEDLTQSGNTVYGAGSIATRSKSLPRSITPLSNSNSDASV